MSLFTLSFGVAWRAVFTIVYLGLAAWLAPLDSPHLTTNGRYITWFLVATIVFGVIALAIGFVYWFRRALPIYQITQLIYEKSGGRDTLDVVFRNGLPGYVSAYGNMVTLHIGQELDTFTYYIRAESTVGISRKRELLLDDANSPAQNVLRWYLKDHVALEKVNERDVARWLRQFIKEHRYN